MADDDHKFSEAVAGFRERASMVYSVGPPREPPVEPPAGSRDNPEMNPLAELTTRMGKVETAIDSLRHSQNILGGVLAGGLALILAILVYFAQDVSGQVRDMNARFDRFLERQADAASAANARFDRLLEQRPPQGAAPIIIQVPAPAPLPPPQEEPSPPSR